MTDKEREEREFISLFSDQRYAKKAWRELIGNALQGQARPLPEVVDKEGQPTLQSNIDRMAYDNVKARLLAEGKAREPMQAELIVECNILRARGTDAAWGTILDRTAGKVKEEITLSNNPFEDLSDDELEALRQYRESKTVKEAEDEE